MAQRRWLSALLLAGAASAPIGCGKSDSPSPSEADPAGRKSAPLPPMQMNIAGTPPVVLGPETIQAEIDKAGSGVQLVPLDLRSVGLALVLEAPEGAKAERDPHGLPLRRDAVDVEITAGDRFAIRIRPGKQPFERKRQQLAGQTVLVNTNDLILSTSMLLLEERCEFARHVVVGLQDYSVENVDPLLGRQVNHSQADCLLMLKCIGTLAPAKATEAGTVKP